MGILSNNVLLVKKGRFGIPSIIVYRLLWGKSTSLFSSTNGNLGHLFMSMSQCSWWNSLTIWKLEVIFQIWKIEGVQIEVIFQSPPGDSRPLEILHRQVHLFFQGCQQPVLPWPLIQPIRSPRQRFLGGSAIRNDGRGWTRGLLKTCSNDLRWPSLW